MSTAELIELGVFNFIENGIDEETKIIDCSNGKPLGVVEIFRHKSTPLYVLSVKTKPSNVYARRYMLRNGTFDHFGLGAYCETDRDIVSYQILFPEYAEAFDFCCKIASMYKDDVRLLNPRGGDFFLPTIPDALLEILDGAIAGDGGVYNRYSSSMFRYALGEKQLDHLLEFKSELEKFGYSGIISKNKIALNYTGIDYGYIYTISWTLKAFNKLRDRWYLGKQKIVPKDLKNSPTFWRWFYAGDGCLYVGSPFSYRVLIAANDFLTDDVDRLISMLNELGIKSTRYLKRYTESTGLPQWTITINDHREVDKFLDYIGRPVRGIEYKWTRPEKPIRVCKNDKCLKDFIPTRGDNAYCSLKCLRNFTDLRHYYRKRAKK